MNEKFICPYCGEDITKQIESKRMNTDKGVFITKCCKDLCKFNESKVVKFYEEE